MSQPRRSSSRIGSGAVFVMSGFFLATTAATPVLLGDQPADLFQELLGVVAGGILQPTLRPRRGARPAGFRDAEPEQARRI